VCEGEREIEQIPRERTRARAKKEKSKERKKNEGIDFLSIKKNMRENTCSPPLPSFHFFFILPSTPFFCSPFQHSKRGGTTTNFEFYGAS
jgi:hypothetical protein